MQYICDLSEVVIATLQGICKIDGIHGIDSILSLN